MLLMTKYLLQSFLKIFYLVFLYKQEYKICVTCMADFAFLVYQLSVIQLKVNRTFQRIIESKAFWVYLNPVWLYYIMPVTCPCISCRNKYNCIEIIFEILFV